MVKTHVCLKAPYCSKKFYFLFVFLFFFGKTRDFGEFGDIDSF